MLLEPKILSADWYFGKIRDPDSKPLSVASIWGRCKGSDWKCAYLWPVRRPQSGNSPQKEEGLCLLKQIAPRSLRKVQHLSPPSKMPPPCLQLWTASSISMQVTFLTHKTTSFPRSRLIQPASTGNRQGSRGGAAVESSPSGMQTLLKKRKIFPSHTDF